MKLMKHITIALVLCAIPAMAFAQDVTCDECTHVVSVYAGHGGFIATAAEDAEMVIWVASCNGVTRSGELTPDADSGVVSMLLADDTACYGDDDGSFEIGPIMDGGWYWITDEDNSAVGGLVDKNVLDNANDVMPTDAGDGVTVTAGSGAVLLKETASGRVGILPTILPVMDMDAPTVTVCGFVDNGARATPRFTRRTSNCAMGNGGTITLATTVDRWTGATSRVMDEASIDRPPAGGSGEVVVTIDLWGNHSGFFTTAALGEATLGQPAFALSPLRPAARLTGVSYKAGRGSGPEAGAFTSGEEVAGITMSTDTPNVVTFTVVGDASHCDADNNYPVSVNVTASITAPGSTAVTPSILRNATSGDAGGTSFTVACAAAASNMGQELVPENPFPTTR